MGNECGTFFEMASKTVSVKVRLTEEELAWLSSDAAERFGGNLSAAVRQALFDGRLFRLVRQDYAALLEEGEAIEFPTHEDGTARLIALALSPHIGPGMGPLP
jgi:hypothetical protein